jgi:hypothetical protein
MEKLSIIILMLFSTATYAASGGDSNWYGDWWENVYEIRVEKEQYEAIQQEHDDQCSARIRWYEQKVDENPTSEYYLYKLEEWYDKCPTY